jgi:hypothetical protein
MVSLGSKNHRRRVSSKHPKKEVQEAIEYAINARWRVKMAPGPGHVWCALLCPERSREGCKVYVYSTPQNPGNHAKRIKSDVDKCPHK